ncbi:MAG: tetratricopeptide repeat protein [Candidatus Shapirobacteria bacterium]
MNLTSRQKKYIKKHFKKESIEKIASYLEVTVEEIEKYLKKRWGKKKYQQFIAKTIPLQGKSDRTDLKKWFNQNRLILLGLVFLVFAVYINSINNDFVSDDINGVLNNPYLDQAKHIFSNPFSFFNTLIRFLINKIFGRTPAFYRIVNILSHAGTTLILYFLLHLFDLRKKISFLAASIFAVHPILTESITWISSGYYSYSAFLALLSFSAYILFFDNKKVKFYFLSLFFYFLALATSEKVIAFPGILLFYEISFGKIKNNWKKLIPFFILSATWAIYLIGPFKTHTVSLQNDFYQKRPQSESHSERVINFAQLSSIAVTSYLELIFWPNKLTLYHSEMSFTQIEYLVRIVLFFLFIVTIFYFYKRHRQIFFWLSFFLISLSPMLLPFGISWIVAERYVYLGSIGVFVTFAITFKKIADNHKFKPYLFTLFGLIIIALGARTVRRNADWKNQDTLWLAAAKTSPSSHQNHNNLGDYYGRQGDFEKAIKEFKIAIEIQPNYADAYHNLANIYLQINQVDLATQSYQKALELNPNLWQSHQNLAAIYFDQGKIDLAQKEIEEGLKIDPQNSSLYLNLGQIYIKLDEIDKAKEALYKSIEYDPQNQKAIEWLNLINQPVLENSTNEE